jgi:hypothetical protein
MYDLVAGDITLGDDDDVGDDDEVGGGEELIGEDSLFIGGRRGKKSKKQKIRVARIQPQSQQQPVNFPQGPNGAAVVTASSTAILTARPQRVVQVGRFVVPSAIGPFFAIGDLVVGRDSMFGNAEFAAAEIFAQNGYGVALRGFIARPGIDITLTVKNLDTHDHAFYGSLIGPALV